MNKDALAEIEGRYRTGKLTRLGFARIIRQTCATVEEAERLRKRWSARKAVIDQEAGR